MAKDDRDQTRETDEDTAVNADAAVDADGKLRRTTDPVLIRSVVEDRGGYPAHASQSEGQGDQGLLRIGFRDRDEDLKEMSWDEFVDEIEEKDLVGIYSEDGSDVDGDRPVVLREHDD